MTEALRIVVFAKAPRAGMVKTRLIPALGTEGAAQLARRLLDHALAQALQAQVGPVELCMSPGPNDAAWQGIELPDKLLRTDQGEGDLGERMARAVHRVTAGPHGQPIVLMGTDCPALTAKVIAEATRQLACHDAVLVPVADGGYVLLGLRAECSEVFAAMPWSTPAVAAETLRRLALRGLRAWLGPTLHDIDEPADLFYLPRAWNFKSDWPVPSVKRS